MTALAIVTIGVVCLVAAKLWQDWCKHRRCDALKEEKEQLSHAICQAIEREPDNLALHLRLRDHLRRVSEELSDNR